MDTSMLTIEKHRLEFYLNRDGEEATIEAAARIHKSYRLSLKFGMAHKNPLFHEGYLRSVVDTRKFLMVNAPDVYRKVLTEIHFS